MGLCSCSRPPRAAAASPPASKWVRFVLFFLGWSFPILLPLSLSLIIFISFYSFPSHIIRHVSLPRGMSHSTGVGCAGGSKVHGGASAWQLSNLSYLHLNFRFLRTHSFRTRQWSQESEELSHITNMYKFTVSPAPRFSSRERPGQLGPSLICLSPHTVRARCSRASHQPPRPHRISPFPPPGTEPQSCTSACLPARLSYSPTTYLAHTFRARRELNIRFSRSPGGRLSNPSPKMCPCVCKCVVTRVLRSDDGQAYRPLLVAQLCRVHESNPSSLGVPTYYIR